MAMGSPKFISLSAIDRPVTDVHELGGTTDGTDP